MYKRSCGMLSIETFVPRIQEYPSYSTPFLANGVVAKPFNSWQLLRLCT
jgi:hypothetical protein